MLNAKTISILAIAGTAVAAPQGWGNWAANYFNGGRGNYNGDGSAVATDVDVVTAYTTVTYNGQYGGGFYGKPQTETSVAVATPSPAAPEKPAASSAAPEKPATSSAAPVASGNTGTYMDVVSEWRSKLGLSSLTQDDKLQGNALKTSQDGNGQMVHELNPGSFAQVLAPGSADDFEKVFVGGWLCERPDMAGLDGVCTTMSQGWAYDGQTGHADILTSKSYSKIGCALANGIWACDLA